MNAGQGKWFYLKICPFVVCNLHVWNAFNDSINLLQCVITVHDGENETHLLCSVWQIKYALVLCVCLSLCLSPPFLSLFLCVFMCLSVSECICVGNSVCVHCSVLCALFSSYPSDAVHQFCLQASDLFFSALNEVDLWTKREAEGDREGGVADQFLCFYSGLWINYPVPKPDPVLWARHFSITPINNAFFCLSI